MSQLTKNVYLNICKVKNNETSHVRWDEKNIVYYLIKTYYKYLEINHKSVGQETTTVA